MTEQTAAHEGWRNPTKAEASEGIGAVIEGLRDIREIEKAIRDSQHLTDGSPELAQSTDDAIAAIAIEGVTHPDDSHADALSALRTALIETALEATGERPAAERDPVKTLETEGYGPEVNSAVEDLRVRGAQTPEGYDIAEVVAREIDAQHEQGSSEAGETVVYNHGKEVQLYSGKKERRFGVAGELDPLEERDITLPDGSRKKANVIIKINATGSPFEFTIVEREGQFAGVTTAPNGETLLTRQGASGHITFRDGDQRYTAERLDTETDGLSWRFFQSGWADRPVSVVLHDGAEIVKRPRNAHETSTRKERSAERRRSWTKRLVGLAAVGATFSSGGFADRIGDGIVDTDRTVAAASALSSLPEPYTMETEIDSIKLKDYPHPQEMIDERNEEIRVEQAKNERSERAVKEVMNDLDAHDYEQIKQRAQEYLANNPGELMEKNELSRIRQNIESASTNEEVMAAISELGRFYGITFDDSEPELDRLQNTAVSVFNVLSTLPKTVVEQSQLKKVGFRSSAERVTEVNRIGVMQGYYSSSDDRLDLYSKSRKGESIMRALSSIPGAQEDYSLENVFAHEFAHALSSKGGVGSSGEVELAGADFVPESLSDLDIIPSVAVDVVRSGVANYPEAISTYSRTNYSESIAENMGGVIHDRSDGLAHPDEVRRFNSPGNTVLVRNLMDLESLQPGLANYFVSINPRLMNRDFTTFGR